MKTYSSLLVLTWIFFLAAAVVGVVRSFHPAVYAPRTATLFLACAILLLVSLLIRKK